MPDSAPWTTTCTAGGWSMWAPDITYRGGRYFLYYSASMFGSDRSTIFLATSSSGNSDTWSHRGMVIESRTTRPADRVSSETPAQRWIVGYPRNT